MTTRAILLAELEEKSHKNNKLELEADVISSFGRSAGYDPYDNPGVHHSPAEPIERKARRRLMRRS